MLIKFIADEAAMLALGEQLAKQLLPGALVYLHGELGAGKTTLVRGLLRGFDYQGIVKSPTYTLVETYEPAHQLIHHFDLYRLAHPEELEYLGLRDYLTEQAICLIEWPERAAGWLPQPVVYCTIEVPGTGEGRQLTLRASTPAGMQIIEHLR